MSAGVEGRSARGVGGPGDHGAVHVAFFRNLNQGQQGHPRTADLLEAFAATGVMDATPIQSNGTVFFASDDPEAVVADVGGLLEARGLYGDVIIARPLSFVETIVQVHGGGESAQRTELTLFDESRELVMDAALIAASVKRRCEVVEHGPGWAVVLNGADRQSNGTPTVESVLGGPATSRGIPTLTRLVQRVGG